MATTYTTKTEGRAVTVIARVQRTNPQINLKRNTGITMEAAVWEEMKPYLHDAVKGNTRAVFAAAEADGVNIDTLRLLVTLRKRLDDASLVSLTADEMGDIIDQLVNADLYEARKRIAEERKRKAEEEARVEEERKRVTFMEFYARFLDDIKAGRVVSRDNKQFAERSRINYQQGYRKLLKYQQERGITVNWDDIDLDFLDDYTDFLRSSEQYSINTIAKRLTEIKHLVHMAHDRKITDCDIFLNSFFNVKADNDTDSVYLTPDDLAAIKGVDLSGKPSSYTKARDLFIVGCCTAQRVSDYAHLKPENIITEREKVIVEGAEGDKIETVERTYLRVTQKKTGAKVIVPCNSEVRAILEKYPQGLPNLCDQYFNRQIKEIAKLAGLNEPCEVKSTKGGKVTRQMLPKWQLVHSHTARRTGATLMYLAGVDAHDICKVTGHASIKMLNRYIRAGQLESAKKLSHKYNFFK